MKGLADKIKPPGYLNKEQKKIFKYIVDQLKASGILSNLDIYVLSTCSIAISRLIEIEKKINEDINLSLIHIYRFNQEEIKTRIKNIFELNDAEADKVYRMWKHKYLNKVNE